MKSLIQIILFMMFLASATFYGMPFLERIAVGYAAKPRDCGLMHESMACPTPRPGPYGFQHTEIWPH